MTVWPTHPAAELFPMLDAEELRELADDIAANGLHEPVWLWDDPDRGTVLLDGRNRLAACALVGVTPATRTYLGNDPIAFVVSENVRRRHLTAGQVAMLTLEVEPLYAAEAKAREAERKRREIEDQRNKTGADLHQSKIDEGRSVRAPRAADLAARTTGASGRGVAQAKRVAQDQIGRASCRERV